MKLQELLGGYIETDKIDINHITENSKQVKKGSLFIAYKGETHDGHTYAKDAEKNGAVAILSERDIADVNIPVYYIKSLKKLLPTIAKNFYNDPSSKIKLIGITGTDGKTTTSSILNQLLNINGLSCCIGTNGVSYSGNTIKTGLTTPKSIQLNEILNDMYQENLTHAVMEVSSQGIDLGRIDGLTYDTAIFTNLSHEHLDHHKSMQEYLNVKTRLFKSLGKDKYAILNADDMACEYIEENISCNLLTYGINNKANIMAKSINITDELTTFDLVIENEIFKQVKTNLLGLFNVYNILASIACCVRFKIEINPILKELINIKYIDGRMFFIEKGQKYKVIVDFAHTPNALEQLLKYSNDITTGNTIIVFGSAGKKDKTKRPIMGKIASEYADKIILTSEDPRSEDVQNIINEITGGIVNKDKVKVIYDRKEAIEYAVASANSDDTILITGKGNEHTQEINGVKFKHNDIDIATNAIMNNV